MTASSADTTTDTTAAATIVTVVYVVAVIVVVALAAAAAILVRRRSPSPGAAVTADATRTPPPPLDEPMTGLESALAQVTGRDGRPIREAIDAEAEHVDEFRVPDDTGPLLRRALDHVEHHDDVDPPA